MNWTCEASSWPAGVLLFLVAALLVGCGRPDSSPHADLFPAEWTPIDSPNASVPQGVQVAAGRNDTMPLRGLVGPHKGPVIIVSASFGPTSRTA